MLVTAAKYLSLAMVFISVWWFCLAAGSPPGGRAPRPPGGRASKPAAPAAPAPRFHGQGMTASPGWTALLGGGLGLLLAWRDPMLGFVLALGLGGAGYVLPSALRRWRLGRRRARLAGQLPDMLELISNSLRAGLSLFQALEAAVKEAPDPGGEVFGEAVKDIRLGLSPEDAFEKTLMKWPNPDLELFVVAATVCRRSGGNLAEITSRLVETLRERTRLQGRIDALTSQGRLSGWVIGLLPLGLLAAMSLLDPELVGNFIRHPLGWTLLAGGAVMELLGAWFIRRIIAIDV